MDLIKYTGFVKQVDNAGRVVLPANLRATFGLQEKSQVEFLVDGDSIILRKYHPVCILCDNAENLIQRHGKNVCAECVRIMTRQIN